jgi:hypothetical protein
MLRIKIHRIKEHPRRRRKRLLGRNNLESKGSNHKLEMVIQPLFTKTKWSFLEGIVTKCPLTIYFYLILIAFD